ncbi:cadherin-related family member 2 [Cheilinus undulatus]|uniref:cadherin-related family member 2 n=1 Tax=Cheilinus undulatus TaxID=241271 RepID=UPI001BD4048E|nr:cadherin-related family member 2 [Cheilinus undulatus]
MSADMEGFSRRLLLCLLLCLINTAYANTTPSIDVTTYTICVDIPPGEYAFTITASDLENEQLTYTITGINAGYFTVEANTGVVRVRRPLNRQEYTMDLIAVVSDGTTSDSADLLIILTPTNSYVPLFEEASYDYDCPENTAVGSSLFKVKATDDDTGFAGTIKYSIDEVVPSSGSGLFTIDASSGEVRLAGGLNYTHLDTFYRLKINATDGGGKCHFPDTTYLSSATFAVITVEDVPDIDPVFINVPYIGSVKEHSPPEQPVLEVTAIDPDTGVNADIIYSIEDSTIDGLFEISPAGLISVLSDIDREDLDTDTVTLTVKGTESVQNTDGVFASTTTSVEINIIDINDKPPKFYVCGSTCEEESHYTVEVLENSQGSIPINMTVKDLDQFPSTKLTLGGADKDVFGVEPQVTTSERAVQLVVMQSQKLDYEKTQLMIVEVIATDQDDESFRSTATVTIHIKDTNDNNPKFPEQSYSLNVSEHSPIGTVVAQITAEDPDTMDQGNITYHLLPESIRAYFDVEEDTGIVYVKSEELLDRELRSLYSATLEARDSDGKPGTTVLEITLLDINDQPPVINRESYQEFIKEGGQLEVKIQATDADKPDTKNSQIVYGIETSRYSDLFTIDPDTGVLTNSGELDREALDKALDGRIELNVTATDKGVPPLSTTVTIIINVDDVNDNKPQFGKPSYEFSVKEGEKGAFVGSVTAEDLDQTTDFNRISFSIIDGSFGSFIIRSYPMEQGYIGNITVNPDIELDYESARQKFTLRVEAADLEQESAEVTVVVNVVDVNDERPEFSPIDPVSVKENTSIAEAVGRFLARDKDTIHHLVYELESMTCRCGESMTPCSYFILLPTGEVTLNHELKVDYEECDQVLIEAQVVDELTEKGENNSATTGLMVINIEDINDNAPEFIYSDAVYVVVSESASKGLSVAGVTATDRDSEINQQVEFEVTKVEFEDSSNKIKDMEILFQAITTKQNEIFIGRIETVQGLDETLKGKYLVTVSATDAGGLSRSTVLEIFTIDETYQVELEFSSSKQDVEAKIEDIRRALIAATKASVEIVSVNDLTETSRETSKSVVVAYFVYTNGTALTSDAVEKMISAPEHVHILEDLGLTNIGTAPVPEAPDILKFALFGVLAGLIVVLAILTTSLMCTRRNFKRKLKAAKAMNSASMVTSDNQKSGPVVPGTNKYTMDGANPVLNLNIDTTLVLDLDEESSDVDKVSLNSLDYSDDMILPEKDTKPFMNMIQEEDEEEEGTAGPPEYIEPLGAVLAQRGPKKDSVNSRQGYGNPTFSTTDL